VSGIHQVATRRTTRHYTVSLGTPSILEGPENVEKEYVLGKGIQAARRLEIQDQQFGPVSEMLLDELQIQPADCIVELGIGAGGLARRAMRRLGKGGRLIGVDRTQSLLEYATGHLSAASEGIFEPILGDATSAGPWLQRAEVVIARSFLHHVPLAETFLGRLYDGLRPGTRIGFLEPEFRAQFGRLARLEVSRPELRPLRLWGEGISRFYMAQGISPSIGATLGWAMQAAGFREVHEHRWETPTEASVIENLLMYYDEVRERYVDMGLMTSAEIDEQQAQLRDLSPDDLPVVWGVHRVTASV
jgi:ubiquinone/menaquinone biosynthesis C-methylase UbiE